MREQRAENREQKRRGVIFAVSGPSGSGKTTLLKKILGNKKLGNKLIKSISFTTRPRRLRERKDKDYFFISEKEFKQRKAAGEIVEWTKYLDHYYGTPKEFLTRQLGQGKNIILCLDEKGVLSIERLYPKTTVTIFIVPPSISELRERIEARCNKTKKEEIKKRLKLANNELLFSRKYDYRIFNKDLGLAIKELQGIVLSEIYKKR
ncbi:MAG: guanylate kinase [Candidatus Omnitrophota bacterium]|nr:guanylate kinase [Candidatus Omnitrophota bacterium]